MALIEKHAPGSFCWIELGTTDQPAAKTFYTSLFGWTYMDFPMGPSEFYTMFQLESRNTGAAYTIDAEMRARGVSPHWMLYISVENADATAAKVQAAGGKVMKPPFDVMNFGRMAVLQDPTGAVFSIWQAMSHPGLGITGVPGTLCWADLMSPDPPAAAKFYTGVFGWGIGAGDDQSGYLHIKNGDQPIGGVPPAKFQPPNTPPHWMLYFFVTNCDASTEKAKSLGAKIYMGPMTMEGVGRMTVLADPQGAAFALFQSMRHD